MIGQLIVYLLTGLVISFGLMIGHARLALLNSERFRVRGEALFGYSAAAAFWPAVVAFLVALLIAKLVYVGFQRVAAWALRIATWLATPKLVEQKLRGR